jgi:lysozyme family protein
MEIYRRKYWIAGSCQLLSYPLAIIHFDGCVNHGVGRANRFLQRAVGAIEDGAIGPQTLSAINSANQGAVIQSLSNTRTNFYQQIANRDASQKMFLTGWMRRINEVTAYSLSKL